VQVVYEPAKVSLEQILAKFWSLNKPEMVNSGQYRSAIFFYNKDQESVAHKELAKLEASVHHKVYTEIAPATEFYKAEEYHQNYYKKNGVAACRVF